MVAQVLLLFGVRGQVADMIANAGRYRVQPAYIEVEKVADQTVVAEFLAVDFRRDSLAHQIGAGVSLALLDQAAQIIRHLADGRFHAVEVAHVHDHVLPFEELIHPVLGQIQHIQHNADRERKRIIHHQLAFALVLEPLNAVTRSGAGLVLQLGHGGR